MLVKVLTILASLMIRSTTQTPIYWKGCLKL